MGNTNLWYWKQNGKVTGPFPAGQIQEYIILKRVHPNDLMSQDKENWVKVSSIPALIPDIIKEKNKENYEERLAATKRWIDDRDSNRNASIESLLDEKKSNKGKRRTITHIVINTFGWKPAIAVFILISFVLLFILLIRSS